MTELHVDDSIRHSHVAWSIVQIFWKMAVPKRTIWILVDSEYNVTSCAFEENITVDFGFR